MSNIYEKILGGRYKTKLPYFSIVESQPKNTAYHDDCVRLDAEFKADLLKEHGVTDNPKAQRCYALAWNYGHSSGLCEVASYFSELVELIK